MNFLCLVAQFYTALYAVGGPYLDPTIFFQAYLAGPFLVALYVGWKVYSWFKVPAHRPLYVKIKDIDVYDGMREAQLDMISGPGLSEEQRRASIMEIAEENKKKGPMDYVKATVHAII
jgi:yeast amino acid transporter